MWFTGKIREAVMFFSVLAPVLAIMLALSAGFQFVLLFGAAMYLAAFWVIRRGGNGSGGHRP